jgi:hypothetical protein
MRFYQQIRTSAPRGLETSGQGFATVARHADIPHDVRAFTDNLSYNSARAEKQPIFLFAHVSDWVVLCRICDNPEEHTGRSNHLVHSLVGPKNSVLDWIGKIKDASEPIPDPAAVMLQLNKKGVWREQWEGAPRWLSDDDCIEIRDDHVESYVVAGGWKNTSMGLCAIDETGFPKKLMWKNSNDSIEMLCRFSQAFYAMDPSQGIESSRLQIANLFPAAASTAWEYQFATLVPPPLSADRFVWFGVRDDQSEGAKSSRETLDPQAAEIPNSQRERREYVESLQLKIAEQVNAEYLHAKEQCLRELRATEDRTQDLFSRWRVYLENEKRKIDGHKVGLQDWISHFQFLINNEYPIANARHYIETVNKLAKPDPSHLERAPVATRIDWEKADSENSKYNPPDPEAEMIRRRLDAVADPSAEQNELDIYQSDIQTLLNDVRKLTMDLSRSIRSYEAKQNASAKYRPASPAVTLPNPYLPKKETSTIGLHNQRSLPEEKPRIRTTSWVLGILVVATIGLGTWIFWANQKSNKQNGVLKSVNAAQNELIAELNAEKDKLVTTLEEEREGYKKRTAEMAKKKNEADRAELTPTVAPVKSAPASSEKEKGAIAPPPANPTGDYKAKEQGTK